MIEKRSGELGPVWCAWLFSQGEGSANQNDAGWGGLEGLGEHSRLDGVGESNSNGGTNIMRNHILILKVALVLAVMGLAGCVSPDTRIAKSPEIYAALPADQQELVRQGRVARGFSRDAVRLALGEPDRRWTRTDALGVHDVWSYITWENNRGQPLYRGWYHLSAGESPFYYMNYPDRREREYYKVIFDMEGKVAELEELSAK